MKVSICFFAYLVAFTTCTPPNYLSDITADDDEAKIDLDELKDIMADKNKRHDLYEYMNRMNKKDGGGDGEGDEKELKSIGDSKTSYGDEKEGLILSMHKSDEHVKNIAESHDETISWDKKSQDPDKRFPERTHDAGDTASSSIPNINSMIGKESGGQFKDPDHPAAYISHGDIIFYDECEEAEVYGKKNPKCENRKKDQASDATTKSNRMWSLPIAYVLDSSLGTAAKDAINKAISEFTLKTCITFVQNSGATDRIRFKKGDKKKNGCSSAVGRQGGEQIIYLSEGCEHKSTAVHEIMHAIGFYHEHEREDRNNYVTVNYNNIQEGKSHNFDRVTSDYTYYGQSYDYKSVMHYGRNDFGIEYDVKEGWWLDERTVTKRKETITPKVNTDLGQCNDCGLSQKDALQLNARHCNAVRTTITSTVLLSQIKRMMVIYSGQSNDDFRHTLLNYLKGIYTTYYFTVSSYNAISGGSVHSFRGYCQYVWRYYNKNVLVCYSRKSATFPSSTKQEEIKNAVLNEIKDKGCDAETYREKGWTKATSYGFGITLVHIVRHGNGLRTTWIGKTKFENYRCKRDCNWLNQCTDHKASLVLMFGQP